MKGFFRRTPKPNADFQASIALVNAIAKQHRDFLPQITSLTTLRTTRKGREMLATLVKDMQGMANATRNANAAINEVLDALLAVSGQVRA